MTFSRFLLPVCGLIFQISLMAQQMPLPPKTTPRSGGLSVQGPAPAKPGVLKAIRDPEAVTAVQAAINAMGGDAAIGQVQNWRAQGQAKGSKESGGTDGAITWEKSGTEFRVESLINGKSNAIVSGRGKPASVAESVAKALPDYIIKTVFVPVLAASALRDAAENPNGSMQFVGRSTLDSKPVIVVRTASKEATDSYVVGRTWYLDVATNLPVRVEYGVPASGTLQVWFQNAVDLSDYRAVGGVQYPFRIATSQRGKPLQTITLASVDPKATIAAADFDAPAGGAR